MDIDNKVTFSNKGYNASALGPGELLVIQDTENALKHNNLPHNTFLLTNQSAICTLYLFLDDFSDLDSPNYILFPSQTISVNLDDGVSFSTLAIKNTHAVTDVAIKEIKYNLQTIKKINERRV